MFILYEFAKDLILFADGIRYAGGGVQIDLGHVRIQLRKSPTALSTLQRFFSVYYLETKVRANNGEFVCNVNVTLHPKYTEARKYW